MTSRTDAPTLRGVRCRSCDGVGLEPVLSLGRLPLPDAFVPASRLNRPDERFPLDVAFCPSCSLMQLVGDVPAERMFVENYLYFSSFSDQLLDHSREHAEQLIADRGLHAGSLVVEVGSNDGYLLRSFVDAGIPAVGVDPAPQPSAAAQQRGVPTIQRFFGRQVARQLRDERGGADVILANNVLAHVPDLADVVGGLALLLADDGVLHVENPYVRELIDRCQFDTIYHEHVCYYSCTSIDRLMQRHGLHLNDVEYFPDLHGGTLRWIISHQAGRTARLEDLLVDEVERGLTSFEYYRGFGARVVDLRDRLICLLTQLRADGSRMAAYGAAAKGTVLLNFVGIGTDVLDAVVDRNVHKHGHFMPGVRVPIVGPEYLLEAAPEYTLLLAWNFADEIVAQQAEYIRRGGRFIRPAPTPQVLSPESP